MPRTHKLALLAFSLCGSLTGAAIAQQNPYPVTAQTAPAPGAGGAVAPGMATPVPAPAMNPVPDPAGPPPSVTMPPLTTAPQIAAPAPFASSPGPVAKMPATPAPAPVANGSSCGTSGCTSTGCGTTGCTSGGCGSTGCGCSYQPMYGGLKPFSCNSGSCKKSGGVLGSLFDKCNGNGCGMGGCGKGFGSCMTGSCGGSLFKGSCLSGSCLSGSCLSGCFGKKNDCNSGGGGCGFACLGKKAYPDSGWAPPAHVPIVRNNAQYTRWWPHQWYGTPGFAAVPHPMVYMPTDTTQLGFGYMQVPYWRRASASYPPIPDPAMYHTRTAPVRAPYGYGLLYQPVAVPSHEPALRNRASWHASTTRPNSAQHVARRAPQPTRPQLTPEQHQAREAQARQHQQARAYQAAMGRTPINARPVSSSRPR